MQDSNGSSSWLTWEGWQRPAASRVALAILGLTALVLLFLNLSRLGLWEPWEASAITIAQEYGQRPAFDAASAAPADPGYNWAVPTMRQKPVATSLLSTWLLSASLPDGQTDVTAIIGDLERNARLPGALFLLSLAMAIFFFLRARFNVLSGLLAALAFLTLPVTYLGAHSVATPTLLIVTTSLAMLAYAGLLLSEERRMAWGAAFGVALTLVFLDARLVGLFLVLGTIATFALSQLVLAGEEDAPKAPEIIGALAIALSPAGLYVLGFNFGAAHVRQILFVSFFTSGIVGALFLTRRTDAARALLSPGGGLGVAMALVTVIVVLHAYGSVNPTLLKDGVVQGSIPSLTFALENSLFQDSVAKDHLHFDIWLRQVGFATFPWTALVPLAIGYLARSARFDEAMPSPQQTLERLLLVWIFASAVLAIIAGAYQHFFYPAYPALAIALGLMLADKEFWAQLRFTPILLFATGFVAVAIIMTLGKDLERYPYRFLETYVSLEKSIKLPDGFAYGTSYKLLKYLLAATLTTGFFGLTSWFFLTWKDVRGLPTWWRERKERAGETKAPPEGSPMTRRWRERREMLEQDSWPARLSRLFERDITFSLIITVLLLSSSVLFLYRYIPRASDHLSQRHIFQTFLDTRKGDQKLYQYLSPSSSKDSVYLGDIEAIPSNSKFLQMVGADERFFAVAPRDRLASINYEVRKRHKRDIHVLNARSSRLLLLSNKIDAGVEDQNHVARAIVDPAKDKPQHDVLFDDGKGGKAHATFDGQLELLGYSLNKPTSDLPSFRRGEDIELTLYFKVLKRVPGSKKIFVHIDTRGNRLHGDHDPVAGAFPTNYWLPGDVVKDTHKVNIGSYSTLGTYNINMGLFQGSARMKVKPKKAHRDNRIAIGKLKVQ